MTDNDIIKALECCSIDDHIGVCTECPFTDICDEDTQALQKYALDLINRQKAEIERLNKEAIKEQLRKQMYRSTVDEIKSEAVKEFAERLKNEIISDTAYGCDTNQHSGYYDYQIKIGDIPEYIDNLVKEMTEGSK